MKSKEEFDALLAELETLYHNPRPVFPFSVDLKAEEGFTLSNKMLDTAIQKMYLCLRYHRECRFDIDVSGQELDDEAGLMLLKMMSTTFCVNSMCTDGNSFSRGMLTRINSYKDQLDSRRETPFIAYGASKPIFAEEEDDEDLDHSRVVLKM